VKHTLLFCLALLVSCRAAPVEKILGEEDMPIIRYLALGDSYTIGESVPAEDRWPNQIETLLEAEGIQAEVTIIARTGWTVDELWEGIQINTPRGTYDLVTLLIGVNDQFRGYSVNEYREDFRFLLGKAIEYAGRDPAKVVVLSIPDWGVTPFAAGRDRGKIAKEIDQFNLVNRAESEKAGVHYVDITSASREVVSDPALIASDGLHPSGRMYALWAGQVLPVVKEIVK
jgi:lysophospholipase L1-like esterase